MRINYWRRSHFAQCIGDVVTSWKDDKGVVFRHTLHDVLFFPDSPVRILSAAKLADDFGPGCDEEGTWITTKRSYSIFTWEHGKYKRTIRHPTHCLPELAINEGYSVFQKFCNF